MRERTIRTAPLEECDLEPALALLHEAYASERRCCPLLPPVLLGDPRRVEPDLRAILERGAIGAHLSGRLVGFMGISTCFPFKGHCAALVGETTHATAGDEKVAIYEALYAGLGSALIAEGARLHIVAHFAGDDPLRATLYRLGFGAFLAEELRDVSPIAHRCGITVRREDDVRAVIDLDVEHRRCYRSPPIFLVKDTDRAAAERGLLEASRAGAALFVHDDERGRPDAYFMVGTCAGEHETANLAGSAFWGRHFSPYLTFSIRYVEA